MPPIALNLNAATTPDSHFTARPASSLIPYRSVAAISSSSAKPASAVSQHNVQGNPGTPPPMSITGKERREVPLPSQEGKKGVMQYALYVSFRQFTFLDLYSELRESLETLWGPLSEQ
jgi:hypothetical protein